MRKKYQYGLLKFSSAKLGDAVRFVTSGRPGQPGAVLQARFVHERNAVISQIQGDMCYVEMLPQLQSTVAAAEGGSAAGIRVPLPITVGASLKIS